MLKMLIISFAVFFLQTASANLCQDEVYELMSSAASNSVKSATKSVVETVLGQSVNDKKFKALQRAVNDGSQEIYTASTVAKQEKTLAKAGFSKSEITSLRKSGVLPNSTVQIAKEVPEKLESVSLDMRKISVEDTRRMKNGEKLNYVIGEDGEPYVLNKAHDFSDDTVWLAQAGKATGKSDEVGGNFIVREAGTLSYNKATKKFEFNTRYGMGASEKEVQELTNKVSKETGQRIELSNPKAAKSETKTYECLDILSAQNSGKNFILNRFVPDNSIALAGIAVGEGLGAGRLQTEQGRQVVAADMIGTNVNVIIGGYIGSKLALGKANLPTALGTRAAVAMGMIDVQKNIYQSVLTTSADERADKIATFDQYHFAGRLAWNHMFEKFLVGNTSSNFNLPNMIYKACQNDSKMKVLINPQTVRFIEKGASAAVYYGLRKSIINE